MHTEITVSANNRGNEAGSYTTPVYVDYKDGGVEEVLTSARQPCLHRK